MSLLYILDNEFQFHKGTIKTQPNHFRRLHKRISIP